MMLAFAPQTTTPLPANIFKLWRVGGYALGVLSAFGGTMPKRLREFVCWRKDSLFRI